jgi:hypothetical protein
VQDSFLVADNVSTLEKGKNNRNNSSIMADDDDGKVLLAAVQRTSDNVILV